MPIPLKELLLVVPTTQVRSGVLLAAPFFPVYVTYAYYSQRPHMRHATLTHTHTHTHIYIYIPSSKLAAVLTAQAGIIPRSIVQLFKNLHRKDLGIVNMTIYVSFVQVYNEQLYDMLRDPRRSSSLEIHEEPGAGIYVSGLSEYAVRNAGDCLALVKLGEENRAIRETHMNTASSRSHSLFQIVVEQTRIEEGAEGERVLKSKFNLVDLAGSEKWDTRKVSGKARATVPLRTEPEQRMVRQAHAGMCDDGGCAQRLLTQLPFDLSGESIQR